MRKHSLIRLSTLLAVWAAPWAFAADTPLDLTKTRIALPMDVAPIIDGVINDEEWAQSGNAGWQFRIVEDDEGDGISGADLRNGEKPDDDTDLSANLYAGVVGENLYIGVRVTDDDISTDSAEAGSENGMTWQDDSVEVFIDGDNSNFGERDTTGENPEVVDTGGQFVITANNAYRHAEAGNPRFDPSSGWFAETKENEAGDGYHAEFRIPLSEIGNPQPGEHIGFTVAINDDDGGGNTDSVLIWTGLDHVEETFGNLVVGHRRYEGLKAAPPIIDGKIEDGEYPGADIVSINPFTGVFRVGDDQPEADDVSFDWRVTHNEDSIYVAVRVTDDVVFSDTATAESEDEQTWNDDSVEIFFDSNESNLSGRDQEEMFDGQFVFTPNGAWRDNEANNPTYGPEGDWWAQTTTAEDGKSWDVEFLIKKSALVGGDREDVPMGFNVNINDDDDGGNRETQLNWDGNPHTESSYGELILLSAIPSDPNAVADRNVRFGRLDQSEGARTETLRIRNAGDTQTLTLSDAAITGPNQDVFTLGDFPTSLAPGEEGLATITFDAGGAKGNYEATLSYKTNDPNPSEADLTASLSASVANLAGPIARYSLDESAGTDLLDVSTFDRHGTYEGGPTLGQDALIPGGTSVLFSGGSYGQVPGDVFDSFIRFSVAGWVNLNDLSDQQTIFAKGTADGAPTFALLSSGGNLEWFSNGESEFASDGAVLTAGTTHHVAVTWSTTQAVLYVDGVAVAEQDESNEIEIVQENPFLVGAFHGGLKMEGRMDDVQFYDRAVPAEDVASLHANPGSELTNFAGPETAAITWGEVDLDTTVGDLIGGPSITFTPFAYDGGNAEGTFWTGDGGTTGDDVLDSVYNSHGWNGDGASITLDGLTAGESYQVQLLGAGDTRGCCNTRNQAASDGTNVSGDFPRGNSSVIGTFTAAGASQEIMIISGTDNGVDPGLSAFILTDAAGGFISASNVGRTEGDDIVLSVAVDGIPALVDLDASGLSAGAVGAWTNAGFLGGDFQPFGDPTVEVIDGVTGVTLDGDGDYFEGPVSTPEIEGSSPRSIIAWVYNPELASEETVISWGKRGGPDGTNMSFNHGFHNNFGAVGHWGGGGPDIGWNPNSDVEDEEPNVPGDAMAGTWTHISYTQTGAFTKVFTNGQLSNSEDAALDTFGGLGILVGAQREGNGVDVTDPLKGSLSIGRVRIFDSTLSDEDILADFVASAADFGVPVDFEDVAGVIGYWRFDEGAGGTVADSSGHGNHGTVVAPEAAWVTDDTLGSVYQSGGGSYVDLGTLPTISLDTDFTWSFWVNAGETDNNNIVFGNRYMPDGMDFAPREFVKFTPRVFEWHVDGGGQNVPGDNTMFVVGEWSHRLVVKSGKQADLLHQWCRGCFKRCHFGSSQCSASLSRWSARC
ncbi:hypothetical protein N8586_00950 [Verrucomicrobiales bacterium]|nr:hypothetical protein [Verrucomicrobiales bacterium]